MRASRKSLAEDERNSITGGTVAVPSVSQLARFGFDMKMLIYFNFLVNAAIFMLTKSWPRICFIIGRSGLSSPGR